MIVDEWRGQAVFHSSDARNWTRQGLILNSPGNHAADPRTVVHVAPLWLEDGQLVATRDTPPISLANVPGD